MQFAPFDIVFDEQEGLKAISKVDELLKDLKQSCNYRGLLSNSIQKIKSVKQSFDLVRASMSLASFYFVVALIRLGGFSFSYC